MPLFRRLRCFALFCASACVLTCCTKSETRQIKVHFSPITESVSSEEGRLRGGVPTSEAGFDCFFVNVMGEKIGEWESHKGAVTTSPNAYFGNYSSLIRPSAGGSLSVQVLAGKDRIVQVVGVVSSVGCPTKPSLSELISTSQFPAMFELARTKQDLTSDTTLNLVSTYNAANARDIRYFLNSPAPAVSSMLPANKSVNAPPTMTLQFSEPIAELGASQLTISGACANIPTLNSVSFSADRKTASVTFSGTCEDGGSMSVTLDPTLIKSLRGTAASGTPISRTYTFDKVGPAISTFTPASSTLSTLPSSLSLTFSETVQNVPNSAVSLSGSSCTTLPSFSVSTSVANATITLSGGSCTLLQVSFNPTQVSDPAGNAGTGTAVIRSYTLDNTPPAAPGIVLSSPSTSPGTDSTPSFSIALEGGSQFLATDTLKIYSSASCAGTVVGTFTGISGTDTTVKEITTTQAASSSVTYSAQLIDSAGNATCSSSHATSSYRSAIYSYFTTIPSTPLIDLFSGYVTPSTIANPKFEISNVAGANFLDGDVVTLYEGGDNTCSGGLSRGTASVSGSSTNVVNILANTDLSTYGAHSYFAKVTNTGGASVCTTTGFSYTLQPPAPINLSVSSALGSDPTPSVTATFSNAISGTVKIYTDSNCSTNVGSSSITAATIVSLDTSSLSEGSYTFYGTITVNSTESPCSTAYAVYTLDTGVPQTPSIAMSTPSIAYGTSDKPSFAVSVSTGTFSSTDTINLYNQAACAGSVVGTANGSGAATSIIVAASTGQIEGTTVYSTNITDSAGNVSACSNSQNYAYDIHEPTWSASVSVPNYFTSTTSTPPISYSTNATDAISGVDHYEVSVGTMAEHTDVSNWQTAGSIGFSLSGLSLAIDSTYYLNMRAVDRAGNYSAVLTDSWMAVAPPTLDFPTTLTAVLGNAYSETPSATAGGGGATISTCAIVQNNVPSPPTWISVNSSCVLSGTPDALLALSSFTVTLTNSLGFTASDTFTLKVTDDFNDSDNTTGFNLGTRTGTEWNNTLSRFVISQSTKNTAEHDSSWTPKWSSVKGYWKMDNTWADSKNGNDGTSTGAGFSSAGGPIKIGTGAAEFFLGSSVAVPSAGALSGTGPFTVSTWIKSGNTGSEQAFYVQKASWPIQVGLYLGVDSAGLALFYTSDASTFHLSGKRNLLDNRWHLITGVRETDGTGKLYVDGALEDSMNSTPENIPADVVYFGRNEISDAADLIGNLDDLTTWTTSLTQKEVQLIYDRQKASHVGTYVSKIFDSATDGKAWSKLKWKTSLPFGKELPSASESTSNYPGLANSNLMSNVLAIWHLNESAPAGGASYAFADSSGNSRHATLTGSFSATPHPGIFQNGIWFDQSERTLATASDFIIDPAPSDVTLSAWVREDVANWGNGADLVNMGDSVAIRSASSLGGAASLIGVFKAGANTFATRPTSAISIALTGWRHVAYVVDSTNHKQTLFLDGIEIAAGTESGSLTFDDDNFTFARSTASDTTHPFTGALDEVAVWGRALSNAEIFSLYRRGANRVRFQVKACGQADCADATTWKGPSGDAYSYFTEYLNNSAISSGVPTGSILTSYPQMLFSDFFSPTPLSGRYFRYQMILESDDNSGNCSAGYCSPEISAVVIEP